MRLWFALILCLTALPARADPGVMCSTQKWGHAQCIRPQHFAYDTCQAIDKYANRHGLDRGFFARLIWQESRFDPNALSPANARGIAQFIPSTAALRGLADPYNPADALEHSAQYLAEMAARYGNVGMAAIGYNGGERRAEGFLQGRGLARETVNYVPIITGLRAEVWRDRPPQEHDMRLSQDEPFLTACYAMASKRRLTRLAPPDPPAGLGPGWGVRVAFARSEKAALRAVQTKTRACRRLVRGEDPRLTYKPHRVAAKKGYFFAQFGRETRAEADKLCRAMRRQGCVCRVVDN